MKKNIGLAKGFASLVLAGVLTVGVGFPVFGAEEVKEKQVLTYEIALKKALDYSITNKKTEAQKETIQKQLDNIYAGYDDLFLLPPSSASDGLWANFDIARETLMNTKNTLELSMNMEMENIKLSITGLFNNIEQQEKNIALAKQKIDQGNKNLTLYKKQYELGMISKQKLEEYTLENRELTTKLALEENKLSLYYAELEKTTGIKNLTENYTLEDLELEYEPFTLEKAELDRYKNSVLEYNMGVNSKKNALSTAESNFENYVPLYNIQYQQWLAGKGNKPTLSYDGLLNDKNVAELDLSLTEADVKLNVEKKYNSLQELQVNVDSIKSQLEKLNLQLTDLERKYNLGLVSRNALENTRLAKNELENTLSSLVVQQQQLKMMFQSPYFAGL